MPDAGQIYSIYAVLNCSAITNNFVEIAILKIDADTFAQLLIAGLRTAIADREYMNKINVFPVADGDTGTNLAATFGAIVTAIDHPAPEPRSLPDLLSEVADIAIDNARGNSGAIMAQYFEGLRESTGSQTKLYSKQLAQAFTAAATQARAAMSKPVEGTLPTVLAVFAEAWKQAAATEKRLIKLFTTAHLAARNGLSKTTEQLTALRKAGVVDAGAQGFVDMLDGIAAYIENDCQHSHHAEDTHRSEHTTALKNSSPQIPATDSNYRFCTECVVEAEPLDRQALHAALETLDCDSLVVAGTLGKARVHLHTNNPAAAFLQCEAFGKVLRQKADDMHRQQHSQQRDRQHKVAIVTDSAADIDIDEIDRLNLHIVPVRLILGETEYLDKVSISPVEFAEKLAQENVSAKTSQPPPGDFRRQFELLTSHAYKVIYISLASKLSGTYQAAQSAVDRIGGTDISLLDSRNLSGGQGLIAMYAAEAAELGLKRAQIIEVCRRIRSRTDTYGLIADLSPAVRGGRVPAYAGWLAKRLGLHPLFRNSPTGELKLYALVLGQKNLYKRFAKRLSKRLQQDRVYRIVISHCAAYEQARQVRSILLANHPEINSCQIVDAGSALGVHLGLGGVAVGIQDYQPATDLLENGDTQ